jgi:hypothetical protein
MLPPLRVKVAAKAADPPGRMLMVNASKLSPFAPKVLNGSAVSR